MTTQRITRGVGNLVVVIGSILISLLITLKCIPVQTVLDLVISWLLVVVVVLGITLLILGWVLDNK